MNYRDLNALVKSRQAQFHELVPRAEDTIYGKISPVWRGFLDARPNLLGPEQFNFFRNTSTSAIYGVGGQKDEGEFARLFHQGVVEISDAQNIPDEIIDTLIDPFVGSPQVQPYRNNLFSTSFLNNVSNAWRIFQAVKRYGSTARPLRICEIGAGYGAVALILHQLMKVESYTIIDLAENLYLSSLFLPMSLPDRTHQLVDPSRSASLDCSKELNFSLPSFTDQLRAAPFDLILNTASLGEMPLATMRAYVSWAGGHLSKNGLFYSFNRFNVRGSEGARQWSDFGLQKFHICSLEPMERPRRPTNQLHSEVVISSARPTIEIDPACVDALGFLIACGFDPQIEAVKASLLSGKLSPDVAQALRLLNRVFSPGSLQAKHHLLQYPSLMVLDDVRTILLSVVELVGGADSDAAHRKGRLLSLDLGLKLEMRLRGLYAEREAAGGNTSWGDTLAPLKLRSPSLGRMSELYVLEGKPHFAGAFRHELRIAP